MPDRLGAATAITCPACGIGDVAGVCTLTRGQVETLMCAACGLYVRNGVVTAHGVDLDSDDVRALARMHSPLASADELYRDPDARPVRLLARGYPVSLTADRDEPPVRSITVRFGRPCHGR